MSDSTTQKEPDISDERKVGDSFASFIKPKENKNYCYILLNIHRVQQIIDCAVAHGRKVAVSGRSMINVISTAIELDVYLTIPDGIIIDIDLINDILYDKIVLITTGSQGEPMSALNRNGNELLPK